MEIITYIDNLEQLEQWQASSPDPVLIAPKELSKRGTHSLAELITLIKRACVPIFLEWDILHTEDEFQEAIKLLDTIEDDLIAGVRVLDVGALEYVFHHKKKWKIQFLAEAGNHNLMALKVWKDYLGDRLDRLVLSKELPVKKWEQYIQELEGKVEWQILGPIELFYSPRKLINGKQDSTVFTGSSDETSHKRFRFIENSHGTFMDFPKDHFLLDKISDLERMKLKFVKIDLRHLNDFSLVFKVIDLVRNFSEEKVKKFRSEYPLDTIQGFYHANKTDVLFKKIKNPERDERGEHYLGQVIAIEKPHSMAIEMSGNKQCSKDQKLMVKTPEGKKIHFHARFVKDVFGEDRQELLSGELGLLPFVKGAQPKSLVYSVSE